MRRSGATCVWVAAAMLGAQAIGADERLVGAWAGTIEWGNRAEAVIEAISKDGQVTGAVCTVWKSGHTGGGVLRALDWGPAYDGWEITALVGRNLVVLAPQGEERLVRWETYATEVGGESTNEAVLRRTTKLLCAHLFADEPRPLQEVEGETGEDLIGYWHGHFGNGQGAELLLENITQDGEAQGRWCWTHKNSGVTFMRNFYPGGPARSRYDAERGRLTVELEMTPRKKDRLQLTLLTAKTVSATTTTWVGTPEEKSGHALLTRGASETGCLAMTYLNDPEGTRDPQARHPRLRQMGERVPTRRQSQTVRSEGR